MSDRRRADANVINIKLSKNHYAKATSFRVEDGSLILQHNGQTVLQHQVAGPPNGPHFWTNETDGPRSLAWTVDVDVHLFGKHSGKDRPIYTFTDQKVYEHFQSECRNADFVREFVTDSITIKGKSYANTVDCNVKIWRSRTSKAGSVTLPVKHGGEIVQQELFCTWLDVEKDTKHSDQVHFTFKVNRAKRSSVPHRRSESFETAAAARTDRLRRIFRLGRSRTGHDTINTETTSAARDALQPAEMAPPNILTKFTKITITFKDSTACLNFTETVQPYTVSDPETVDQTHSDAASSVAPSSHGRAGGSPNTDLSPASSPVTTPPPTDHVTDVQDQPDIIPPLVIPEPLLPPDTVTTPPLSRQSFDTRPSPGPSEQDHLVVIPPYVPPGSPRLTALEIQEQRRKFWYRQNDSAPIARSARIRAESNKIFYATLPFDPKQDLRLLHIVPGRNAIPPDCGNELKLHLETVSLESAKDTYEALSYSWGPGEDIEEVILNQDQPILDSDGQRKKFKISLHLYQALIRLRLTTTPRTVWIDAICINQSDVLEMNHQVPKMGQIYKQAKRTIIWITEFEETVTSQTCIRTFPADDDEDKDSRTLCAQQDGSASEHGDLDIRLKRLLGDFHETLERTGSGNAWYLRLWCVQEFYFSKKLPSVYLGQHAIGWSHFATILKKIAGDYGPMTLFDKLRDSTQTQRTMHELCATTGAFRVSDPRDRIYSLLNMTEPHPAKVEPDYAKSILEVLEEVTLYLILESNLDVLLDMRVDRSFGEGFGLDILPSYIPDLTQLQALNMCTGPDHYRTGGNNAPDIELCKDDEHIQHTSNDMAIPRVLKIKAMLFDRIEYFTTVDDIPEHETSPSGALIYNNFEQPGRLIQRIVDALHLTFEQDMRLGEFDRTAKIGRLILEFVLEEKRNHLKELERVTESAGISLKALYKSQAQEDVKYVDEEDIPDSERKQEADNEFVLNHWKLRTGYIHSDSPGLVDITKVLDVSAELWQNALASETVRNDFRAATDFENLFCYARRTKNKYYFSGYDYHEPMRRDVLTAKSLKAIKELETRFRRDDHIELHEYSDKARQRDFFRTKAGFVGLGPATMQSGDLVVIPYGASRPFILRHIRESEAYTLVGEAVLPGVMHGQWIAEHAEDARYYKLK